MKFFVGELSGTLAVIREDGVGWTSEPRDPQGSDGRAVGEPSVSLVDFVGSDEPEFWSEESRTWTALVGYVEAGGLALWPKGWLSFGFSLCQLRHQLGNPHVTAMALPAHPTALDLARHTRNLHLGLTQLVGLAIGNLMADRDCMRKYVEHREALARSGQRRADGAIARNRADIQQFRGNGKAAAEALVIAHYLDGEQDEWHRPAS